MHTGYHPDFNPTGIEGGIDTHALPWLDLPQAPGLSIKPLRASLETGMFTVIVRVMKGSTLLPMVHLGAMDLLVLSGAMSYPHGPLAGTLAAGSWAYVPANARVAGWHAEQDTECLVNFYGPLAFLDAHGKRIHSILTSLDVLIAARAHDITLVPNTLAECMAPRAPAYQGTAAPLAINAAQARAALLSAQNLVSARAIDVHPHFVDTRQVPWAVNRNNPDFGMKILRVSEETGVTSMIVKHNGVAGPHYHLAAADFLVLNGRIGYRAGPPQGYGPGVWFFEPAGARDDATQRLGEEDLIYTANVYGPLQFDQGRGTPISAVVSWMNYKRMAEASGARLVSNTFDDDASLLAWAPLHG